MEWSRVLVPHIFIDNMYNMWCLSLFLWPSKSTIWPQHRKEPRSSTFALLRHFQFLLATRYEQKSSQMPENQQHPIFYSQQKSPLTKFYFNYNYLAWSRLPAVAGFQRADWSRFERAGRWTRRAINFRRNSRSINKSCKIDGHTFRRYSQRLRAGTSRNSGGRAKDLGDKPSQRQGGIWVLGP